jgi:hypothetical protein
VARPPAIAPSPPADEPLLPRTYDENDLRAAVGVAPLADATKGSQRKTEALDDDELPRRPRNRKLIAVAVIAGASTLAIATLALLGTLNRDRFVLVCEAERAVPHQGRGFPPWGTRPLEGGAWKPLKITPETRCQPHESDDPLSLERRYLAMVLEQANGLLAVREVTRLDEADALLEQALLLTRPPAQEPQNLAAERGEHRKEVERLRGDVAYWRAIARVRDATAALSEAAKQFESAAAQQPRHVADAPTWASYARKLIEELRAGPTRAAAATPDAQALPVPERTEAPAGVALPVEPAAGSASESPPAVAPPDAGVPSGGVLL